MEAKKITGWVLVVLGILALILQFFGCKSFSFGGPPPSLYHYPCLFWFSIIGIIFLVVGIVLVLKKK